MNPQDTITKTMFYKHSPEVVWKALTTKEAMSEWFMKTDFEPKVGASYVMTYKEKDGSRGIVTEVIEPTKLSYTWLIPGSDIETRVEWFLEKKDDGTQVTLTHSGFEKFGDDQKDKTITKHTDGWDFMFISLEKFLNK